MTSGLVIDRLPLWLIFSGSVAFVLVAWELGFRLAARRTRRATDEEAFASEIIAAVLGLLAFLLAFTFSLASDRYQDRQALAEQEVEAIRAVYMSAGLIDEPYQSALRTTLQRYVDLRLDSLDTQAQLDRMLARSTEIHVQLARIADHVERTTSATGVRAFIAQQIENLVGLNFERLEVGKRTRTPAAVVLTLFLVIAVTMFTIGWHAGERGLARRRAVRALAVSFGVVLALISVLDRTANALVHENQHLMVELRAWMEAQPAP